MDYGITGSANMPQVAPISAYSDSTKWIWFDEVLVQFESGGSGGIGGGSRCYSMTVCIAAICRIDSEPAIIAASDCLLVMGNTKYEPTRSKMFALKDDCLLLIAGDTLHHGNIMARRTSKIHYAGFSDSCGAGGSIPERLPILPRKAH